MEEFKIEALAPLQPHARGPHKGGFDDGAASSDDSGSFDLKDGCWVIGGLGLHFVGFLILMELVD